MLNDSNVSKLQLLKILLLNFAFKIIEWSNETSLSDLLLPVI